MTRIFTPIVLATLSTDWGPMHIAAGPDGVVAAELLGTLDGFLAGLARRGLADPVPLEAAPAGDARSIAAAARDVLAAALRGEAVDLRAIPIDIADRPAWDRLVLEGVRTIPRGETASYGEIARRIGRPRAARAVGGAVGRNPVGMLVPCHRVIAGDGSLGGYGAAAWGGVEAALELKRALLRLEGVEVRRDVSPMRQPPCAMEHDRPLDGARTVAPRRDDARTRSSAHDPLAIRRIDREAEMADEKGTSQLFGENLPGTGGDYLDTNDVEGHSATRRTTPTPPTPPSEDGDTGEDVEGHGFAKRAPGENPHGDR
jgi:methylated-DNA-[protein]-cysteine S-methyltransferase